MRLPFVTIGMPCLNEAAYIEEVLGVVLAQDYPADRFEVLVADGGSRDASREIVARVAARDPRVRLIDNPGRVQAAGMNEVIRRARGEIIVRMDVHADYAKDFVRESVEVLVRTGADNAGGAARLKARNLFQRALCRALNSPLGVGGSRYRNEENEGFVESVFNGAFRRSVFDRVGLYDARAITNEDAELNQRIIASGGTVYLSRDIRQWYYPRDSVGGLARQYFEYGKGRARTLLKHKRLLSIRPVMPFLMLVGLIVLFATSRLQPFTPWVLGAYGLLCALEALRVGRKLAPIVLGIFPVLHAAHGAGFAAGLFHYLRRPDWNASVPRLESSPTASSR